MAETRQLLTSAELADRLNVQQSTVQTWARKGKIPVVRASSRIHRFDYDAVLAALTRRGKKRAGRG